VTEWTWLEWVWPWAFTLLPLPLLVRWLASALPERQAALTVPHVTQFASEIDSRPGLARRIPWRTIVLWLVWIALVSATARPQWTAEPISLPVTGRDLMLAVDISGSMGTEDLELGGHRVTRLAVVKNVVRDFIGARQGDRVGLILFGTNAYLQAPLTFDLSTVNRLLSEAPVGIAGGKTALGDAIGLAVKRLMSRPEGDRILILLTDGANNVGEVAPVKAAELAAQGGVRIHTIGVGADEMRMPSLFGNMFGSRVVNPSADLDEESLKTIANTTGGQYFRAQNTQRLRDIYRIIDDLEPIEQDAETYRPTAALFHWPLTVAWCLLLTLMVWDWRGWRRD
jgi:Ca-activated chloride channel family protein